MADFLPKRLAFKAGPHSPVFGVVVNSLWVEFVHTGVPFDIHVAFILLYLSPGVAGTEAAMHPNFLVQNVLPARTAVSLGATCDAGAERHVAEDVVVAAVGFDGAVSDINATVFNVLYSEIDERNN